MIGRIFKTHQVLVFAFIFYLASFGVRLIYLTEIRSMPTFESPVMDERYHLELARQINSPEGLPKEPFFRAPLYPYFLAMIYRITGGSLFWCRFIQIALASFLPVLILLLGLMLFTRTIAYISAAIAVFYPTLIYYDASLLITFLEVLLFTLVIYQLYRCQKRPGSVNFALAGLLIGLAGLARPNVLLVIPALIIWIWLILSKQLGWKAALVRYLTLIAVAAITISPATVRNYVVSGEFVPIAWQGGFNFYIGNNLHASGWSATVPGIDVTWQGGYRQMISIAEYAMGHKLRRSEVSDYWYRAAMREIFRDPGHFLKLILLKLRFFINGYEIPNNQHIYMANSFAPVLAIFLHDHPFFFPYGILAPLACVGLLMSLVEWRKYLLIYLASGAYVISFLLFFVCARFRQPLIPILILFAVYAIARFSQFIKKKQLIDIGIYAIIAAALLFESNHFILNLSRRRIEADSSYLIGSSYLTIYKEGVRGQPDKPLTDPLPNEIIQAQYYFRQALASDSTFGLAYNDLGTIAMRRRRWDEAVNYFQKAETVDATKPEPFLNHFMVFVRTGRPAQGVPILEQAARLFPMNEEIFMDLGLAYLEIGEKEKAKTALTQCLRINPNNARARKLLDNMAQ